MAHNTTRQRILIANADTALNVTLENIIQTAHFTSDTVHTTTEALAHLKQYLYHAIVIDPTLHNTKGSLLSDIVFASDNQLPIIVLTKNNQPTTLQKGIYAMIQCPVTVPHYTISHLLQQAVEKYILVQENIDTKEKLEDINCNLLDLVARKTKEVMDSEKRYRELVETSTDIIFRLNPDATCAFLNSTYTKIFGHTLQSVLHKDICDILQNLATDSRFLDYIRNLITHKTQGECEITLRDKIGHPTPFHIFIKPLYDPFGIHTGFLGFIKDISEKRRLDALREKLIQDITHELRTPIIKIEGAFDMLGSTLLPKISQNISEDTYHMFRIINKGLNRLKADVEAIISLSRWLSGDVPIKKERVILSDILQHVLQKLTIKMQENNISIQNEVNTDKLTVYSDSKALHSIIYHIIANNIKFNKNVIVTIKAKQYNDYIEIVIEDNGVGVQSVENLFDIFYQENPSIEGSGMGLSLCRYMVIAHKGIIKAEVPEYEKGLRIIIHLPYEV